MTKISKAKMLIKEHGKEYALNYYNSKIADLVKIYDPRNFSHVCEMAALETVVNFINEYENTTGN